MLTRVWFNKGFSVLEHMVSGLSADFEALVSHTHPEALPLRAAKEAFLEPAGLVGEAYVDYCLTVSLEREVEVFVPSKERERLSDAKASFEAQGTRLLVPAGGDTLRLLERKADFMAGVPREIVPVPDFRVFRTLEDFERGVLDLGGEAGERLCFKPSRGIYGHGFRILTERDKLENLLSGDTIRMSYRQARALFADAGHFAPMLLMRYLEGHERSVDCLAHAGKLVAGVVRRKDGEVQLLEHHPRALEIAARLTAHYGLSGIFNVQLRDSGGAAHLLEINARPSGGLYQSMESGLNFLEWSLRLFLGLARPADVPAPRTGLRVVKRQSAVTVGEEA